MKMIMFHVLLQNCSNNKHNQIGSISNKLIIEIADIPYVRFNPSYKAKKKKLYTLSSHVEIPYISAGLYRHYIRIPSFYRTVYLSI